jgi:hypothetical protein
MKNKIKIAFCLPLSIALLLSLKTAAQDPNWVRTNTWYFDNFIQAEVGWDVFRETFIGVAPAPSADFDLVFYEAIHKKKLFETGHCYGMDVLALMLLKNGGHLGYCHPPYIYGAESPSPTNDTVGPSDPILRRAIQIMHGYQISHGFLSYLLDVIARSKNRDGREAFQQVNYYAAKNDPCIISITKDLSPAGGGHVLIPYHTADLGATKRIYCYDPNWSYYEAGEQPKYDASTVYIDVNSATGAWTALNTSMGIPSKNYNGSPSSGGNCIAIPISIAGRKDRLPQSLLAEGAYALNTIFIFSEGNAKIEQISDPLSNRHYRNTEETDVETDEAKRLPYIMPFIPLNGGNPNTSGNEIYFVRGQPPALDVHIRATGKYRVGFLFGGKYTEIKAEGTGGVQTFKTPHLAQLTD